MNTLDANFDMAAAGHGGWLQPLQNWPEAIRRALQSEASVARVVIAAVRGSAPREAGTCMLVGRSSLLGTIGGGHLEWVAIDTARRLLDQPSERPVNIQRLVLGADLAQCCGGVVDVWIERYTPSDLEFLDRLIASKRHGGKVLISRLTPTGLDRDLLAGDIPRTAGASGVWSRPFPLVIPTLHLLWPTTTDATLTESLDEPLLSVWLFGAGHVGQALARVLATLPVRTTWIDSRRDLLPDESGDSIDTLLAERPDQTVPGAPPHTYFIVMTHDHALDYALCRLVLERGDFAYLGVIGSKSKAARFRSRLVRDGVARERIEKLRCPIGVDGLKSKVPAVIAVAIAAQLLQAIEARSAMVQSSSPADVACDANGAACGTCGLLHRAS